MALSLEIKKEHVSEIAEKLKSSQWILMVDPIGLNVAGIMDLRNKLRENNVGMKVYKNTLIARAIDECGDENLKPLKDFLTGPTALSYTTDDPIVATRVLVDFAKDNDSLTLKAASCEGDYWDEVKIAEMSKLGSKKAIYGGLISTMLAPINKLVFVLTGPGRDLVGTLDAIADKDEK